MSSLTQLTPIQKRRQRGAFILLILSIGSLIGFGILQKTSAPVTYRFVLEDEWIELVHAAGGKQVGTIFANVSNTVHSIHSLLCRDAFDQRFNYKQAESVCDTEFAAAAARALEKRCVWLWRLLARLLQQRLATFLHLQPF